MKLSGAIAKCHEDESLVVHGESEIHFPVAIEVAEAETDGVVLGRQGRRLGETAVPGSKQNCNSPNAAAELYHILLAIAIKVGRIKNTAIAGISFWLGNHDAGNRL